MDHKYPGKDLIEYRRTLACCTNALLSQLSCFFKFRHAV